MHAYFERLVHLRVPFTLHSLQEVKDPCTLDTQSQLSRLFITCVRAGLYVGRVLHGTTNALFGQLMKT